jgi:hypothetical protein
VIAYRTHCEYTIPDDQRCEAMCPADRNTWQIWRRFRRRCPRKAQQCRDGYAVCSVHAVKKDVEYLERIA